MAKVAAEVGSTANRYQILAKLAVGGMAEIFLARGASVAGVERYCVLKRILPERAGDADLVRMFVDEARLAAQLQHPNIAAVYDVGMLGDSYFFTMEYVHGETIRSLIQRAQELRRPVPLACVLTIIAGAAAGLHHAHERNANDGRPLGIVHRDVSPSNVMVSFEGHVKVVDFGVAMAADRAVETQSGTVRGKISYLSPEQCRGTRVDRRSDMFSLGIVMWEMLTGARLYQRASDFENMTAIVYEPPPPPSSRRRDVPPAIDTIVLRLLAKDAGDRFQTAAAVVEAIEDASMRAGTILSTSAVSRLVGDLFGARSEPWLELDPDTLPHEAVTVLVPNIPGVGPIAAVEAEIVGVLDPSSSSTAVETEEILVSSDLAAPRSPSASSTQLSAPSSLPSVVPAPVAGSALAFEPDSSLDATILSDPPADAVASASSSSGDLVLAGPKLAAKVPGNSTLLGVGAPPASGTRESSAAFQTRERIGSLLRPMPSLPDFAPSSMAAPRARGVRRRSSRIRWPLLAVIVLAGVLGAVIVRLAMGEPSRGPAPAADNLEAAPALPGDAGFRQAIRAGQRSASLGSVGAPIDASSARRSEPPGGAADAVTASEPVHDAASREEPRAASAGASPAPPPGTRPAPPAEAAPRPRPAGDAGAARRPAPEKASPPASAPLGPPPPAPKPLPHVSRPSPPVGESMQVWLSSLYHQADYATIVQICSEMKVTVDIAGVCVLAACQDAATAKARIWLSEVAKPSQNAMKARCKELAHVDLDGH